MNRFFFYSGAKSTSNGFKFVPAPEWLAKSPLITNSLTAF